MSLSFKVISAGGNDKGKIIASCEYSSDALAIAGRWLRREVVVKWNGRIVWDERKEAVSCRDNLYTATDKISERMRAYSREKYDAAHGTGAYDRMLEESNARHEARLAAEKNKTTEIA